MSCVAIVIALGLGSRHAVMPDFVKTYAGDFLWGVLFFALGAYLWPTCATVRLWCGAVAVTEGIEGSRLWRPAWLEHLRTTAVGGLLLGHGFSWSDVVCVAAGATAAALLDALESGALRRMA